MRPDDISDQSYDPNEEPVRPTDGGPAYPSQQGECADGTWNQTYEQGMSLRDWFAGQALAGLCALPCAVDPEKDARLAYKLADAMLRERERG